MHRNTYQIRLEVQLVDMKPPYSPDLLTATIDLYRLLKTCPTHLLDCQYII